MQTGCVDKLDVLLVCTTKKCNLFGKVIMFATNFFCKVVQQQYVGEVGKSIIVMLQINSVLYNVCQIQSGPKNCHPFSFCYSFYKCWPISIIFGTHYTELIYNITIIDLPTSPTYCCCITLQKKSVAKIIILPILPIILLYRLIKHPVYPHNQSALNPK